MAQVAVSKQPDFRVELGNQPEGEHHQRKISASTRMEMVLAQAMQVTGQQPLCAPRACRRATPERTDGIGQHVDVRGHAHWLIRLGKFDRKTQRGSRGESQCRRDPGRQDTHPDQGQQQADREVGQYIEHDVRGGDVRRPASEQELRRVVVRHAPIREGIQTGIHHEQKVS